METCLSAKFTYASIGIGGNSTSASDGGGGASDANALDRKLEEMRLLDAYNLKLLLLGAGESGKSTVVKQIKLIYKAGGGVSAREKQDIAAAIRRNAIECMQVLLSAGAMLSIPLGSPALMTVASDVLAVRPEQTLTEELAVKIEALWRDHGVQAAFDRRSEYWNLDGTPYYLNNVRRFACEDFELTEEDLLMARVRTTGIVITRLPDPPFSLQVVDVGGQRSERRKWIHCFDNVDAIVFLEGLAGYNQGGWCGCEAM
jgi:GTPase SAR1 family protein